MRKCVYRTVFFHCEHFLSLYLSTIANVSRTCVHAFPSLGRHSSRRTRHGHTKNPPLPIPQPPGTEPYDLKVLPSAVIELLTEIDEHGGWPSMSRDSWCRYCGARYACVSALFFHTPVQGNTAAVFGEWTSQFSVCRLCAALLAFQNIATVGGRRCCASCGGVRYTCLCFARTPSYLIKKSMLQSS